MEDECLFHIKNVEVLTRIHHKCNIYICSFIFN